MDLLSILFIGLHLFSITNGKDAFSFEDFLTNRYGQRGFGGSWISDDEIQRSDNDGNVVVWNVTSNLTSIAIPASILSESKAQSYKFSPNRQHLLISYDTQAQFRHSTTASFTIYSFESSTYASVANGSFLQTAQWGPVGQSLLYILENDLYYTSDVALVPVSRITQTGIPGIVYNGVPDWVYEEEVLAASTAYWFSPSGTSLVYLQFNDTQVPEMSYSLYGKPGVIEDQYPTTATIRYPKSGATNPSYQVHFVNLTDTLFTDTLINQDPDGKSVNYGFVWNQNDQFIQLVMNRVQNESEWLHCHVSEILCHTMRNRKISGGWDRSTPPLFDSTGEKFITVEDVKVGQEGTFSQLVFGTLVGNATTKPLTLGPFAVLSIIGWDDANDSIYFLRNTPEAPAVSHVYKISSDGTNEVCVTCNITTPEGNRCLQASASFSLKYRYLILTCSGPDPITVALYKNEYPLGEPITILESNDNLRQELKSKDLPTRLNTKVEVQGGFLAEVQLRLPPNFDENLKYPLLINVYAGPDSNQVSEGYSAGWDAYLATSLGIIYGYIDGRGSGKRSAELTFANYRSLGTDEIMDQINVTKQLQNSYKWIDASRTAIWGWSYGGYATGRTLELDTEGIFKCGISVAPVTSWLYYDSIYTERYMGLPTKEDNLVGYLAGDLVSKVDNLKTKQYYLIHGSGDDNVHYQQSMLLSRALELNDVLFQQQSYPDENHSLGGVSRHLYHSMDTFWKKCFDIQTTLT